MKPACLFISYDGLLDPLGASQILPYLRGIAKHPRQVCILSFEKPKKYRLGANQLMQELKSMGIIWQPIMFSSRFSFFGKAWDFLKMYLYAAYFIYRHHIKIIHARGHVPAQVGLFWKRLFSCQLLFDFRGLWVDERVDKASWDLSRAWDASCYRYFKKIEKKLIQASDYIVVLTKAVIPELTKLGLRDLNKVNVIPCCADFNHFHIKSMADKKKQRQQLLVPENALVIGYLGSVGKMYMMDEFFKFFLDSLQKRPDTFALILTHDIALTREEMQKYITLGLQEQVIIRPASRAEMPLLIAVMDVMLSFIQPSYARLATSPTKIAESLACGVPVIANTGIGDITQIFSDLQVGTIVHDFSQAIDIQDIIQKTDALAVRNKARTVFDLENAHYLYEQVYKELDKELIC